MEQSESLEVKFKPTTSVRLKVWKEDLNRHLSQIESLEVKFKPTTSVRAKI